MKWLRAKIKQVTSLALLALAINLALAFGHLHLEDLGRAETSPGVLLSAIFHHQDRQSDRHRGHPDDLCPICMAQTALGTGLAAAAPMLPVDLTYAALDPTPVLELAIPQRPRALFSPAGRRFPSAAV